MKKILYITDQEEYSQNGTLTALFDNYLREYFNIDFVFITKYKFSFQIKDNHFIVPAINEENIIEYLESKDIDISSYNFIFVRNKKKYLENVLKNKDRYSYKIAFRISYPKKYHKLKLLNLLNPFEVIKAILYKTKIKKKTQLINKCDLFLPSSVESKEKFYSEINITSFPVFPGLDPDKLNTHIISNDNIKNFIYVGTIDKLREFNIILDAFNKIQTKNWKLTVSTTDKTYVTDLKKKYPKLHDNINLATTHSLEELRAQINEHDVGIALLPQIDLYDTVIADKVIDYATCSLPALLTNNKKNNSIFKNEEAIFCDFNSNDISLKLEELINTSNVKLSEIGNKGQLKLLSLKRNYKTLAKQLSDKLNEI